MRHARRNDTSQSSHAPTLSPPHLHVNHELSLVSPEP